MALNANAPPLPTGVGVADVRKARNLVSNWDGFGVSLAVSAAFRTGSGLQIGTDRSLAQLAAEDLKIVRLVTRSDRLEVIAQRWRIELVCRSIGRV